MEIENCPILFLEHKTGQIELVGFKDQQALKERVDEIALKQPPDQYKVLIAFSSVQDLARLAAHLTESLNRIIAMAKTSPIVKPTGLIH